MAWHAVKLFSRSRSVRTICTFLPEWISLDSGRWFSSPDKEFSIASRWWWEASLSWTRLSSTSEEYRHLVSSSLGDGRWWCGGSLWELCSNDNCSAWWWRTNAGKSTASIRSGVGTVLILSPGAAPAGSVVGGTARRHGLADGSCSSPDELPAELRRAPRMSSIVKGVRDALVRGTADEPTMVRYLYFADDATQVLRKLCSEMNSSKGG